MQYQHGEGPRPRRREGVELVRAEQRARGQRLWARHDQLGPRAVGERRGRAAVRRAAETLVR